MESEKDPSIGQDIQERFINGFLKTFFIYHQKKQSISYPVQKISLQVVAGENCILSTAFLRWQSTGKVFLEAFRKKFAKKIILPKLDRISEINFSATWAEVQKLLCATKRASHFILEQDALLRRFNVLIRFYNVKENVYRLFGVSPNSKRADRASRIALISNLSSTPFTFHIAGKNLEQYSSLVKPCANSRVSLGYI